MLLKSAANHLGSGEWVSYLCSLCCARHVCWAQKDLDSRAVSEPVHAMHGMPPGCGHAVDLLHFCSRPCRVQDPLWR
eukprot:4755923-Amphidinium_carterae.1